MNFTKQRNRYILLDGNTELGQATNLDGVAKLVGCSIAMLYKTRTSDKKHFTFGGVKYTIIDKLDLI